MPMELAARELLNSRMAYVSISCGAHDAQLFTNDRKRLPTALGQNLRLSDVLFGEPTLLVH
jgi:hypothetical protein